MKYAGMSMHYEFIWAHFLLRKKPGFPGLRMAACGSQATTGGYAPWLRKQMFPQPLQSLAHEPVINPL
jgi:hypothetical protein